MDTLDKNIEIAKKIIISEVEKVVHQVDKKDNNVGNIAYYSYYLFNGKRYLTGRIIMLTISAIDAPIKA